ncbi:MAG TPA: adenosine deaminase family protein [Steroidobacteraceae bacterium]|nr:adenosine deaminase family protein [Steroidobacteraceae bacterium]
MPASPISAAFVAELPKTDLHVHLDGSLRLPTLIELAREGGVKLPSATEGGLRETVFKERYASLGEYLRGFQYTVAALQTAEALERAAAELAEDNQAEGVRYLEVRFAPQLHVHPGLDAVQAIAAVDRGLRRARDAWNQRAAVLAAAEPPFEYGIICCAMRMFTGAFSQYYATLFAAHPYARAKELYSMASIELARAAVAARDGYGLQVVGFDLAGEEAGYPAGDHKQAYDYAHRHFLKKTVHAGEAYGPESIFQAITDLHADRIGHGTYLLEPDAIRDEEIGDREHYVERLGNYIADRRITLEVCLTSNLQTHPQLRRLEEHAFSKLRAQRLSTTICTDNRLVSNTTVTNELLLACTHLGLDRHDLKSIIVYGFKRSFFPGSYLRKRQYVRQIIDYYDRVEARHLGTG